MIPTCNYLDKVRVKAKKKKLVSTKKEGIPNNTSNFVKVPFQIHFFLSASLTSRSCFNRFQVRKHFYEKQNELTLFHSFFSERISKRKKSFGILVKN